MQLDLFQSLTIVNSVVLALLPLVFFRRQKVQEIKYREISELNVKLHDITRRADTSLNEDNQLMEPDYKRLIFLISRFKKHSRKLSDEILSYKDLWDRAVGYNGKKRVKGVTAMRRFKVEFLAKSEIVRDMADKLLR